MSADQIAVFVDRILSLKADEDQIKKDIRVVYEEAVDADVDKTGLGQLVTYLRKREKNSTDFDAKEAIFLGYLELYNASLTRTHAYARARTGEIHEPDATPAGAVVAIRSGVTGGESAATYSKPAAAPSLANAVDRSAVPPGAPVTQSHHDVGDVFPPQTAMSASSSASTERDTDWQPHPEMLRNEAHMAGPAAQPLAGPVAQSDLRRVA